MPPEAGLKLRAEDADDLTVISACLQDALVAVRDLAYDRDDQTFMLVANRFRWERSIRLAASHVDDGSALERVLCGVSFGAVKAVSYRGFRRSDEERILPLLAIRGMLDAGGATIDLDFAGDAAIRLTAGAVRCIARDLGEPWPTVWQPEHPPDGP